MLSSKKVATSNSSVNYEYILTLLHSFSQGLFSHKIASGHHFVFSSILKLQSIGKLFTK